MTDTSLSDATETPQRPPSVDRAFWAALAWVSLSVVTVLVQWAHRGYLRGLLLDYNKNATKKQDYSTTAKLDHAVNSYTLTQLVVTFLLGFLIMLTALQMRRGRGWARWVLLAVAVIPIFGVGVVQQLVRGLLTSAPILVKVTMVAAGLAALGVVVLLLMPDTSRYFASLRTPAAEGGRPSMFGSLFGQPRRQSAPPPPTSPAPTRRVIDAQEVPVPSAAKEDVASVPPPAAATSPEPPARPKSGAKPKTPTGTARSKSRKK
jgi:hypothetical protein